MKSLFHEKEIEKIRKIRKVFLWAAVWILIAELVAGVVLILTRVWNTPIGKLQGTFLIIAAILFAGVNSFIRMERGGATAQVLSLISLGGSLICGVLGILLLWEAVPARWMEETTSMSPYGSYTPTVVKYHPTGYAMTASITLIIAVTALLASNVIVIRETIKPVKPLKITALVCLVYLCAYGIMMTIVQPNYSNVMQAYELALLAGGAFWVTALAALIISHVNEKKKTDAAPVVARKTDAELRAEIEEKVRYEIIEKEVRARLEKEIELATGQPQAAPEAKKDT